MSFSARNSLVIVLAVLAVSFAVTGCTNVQEGIEAGLVAAQTVEHLATETDRLLGDVPVDDAAARAAVASALDEMVEQAGADPNITQAVLIAIREKVKSWEMEDGQDIVDMLSDLESRLAAGEVDDVQAAVDELTAQLNPDSM